MKKPTFTVFTPTYNRETLINRVYESLNKQTFRDFEWLVIDDGSTDNTESKITEYSLKSTFPITYIKKVNNGKVAAINDALDVAKGTFFLVFDSDDWCSDNALERFYMYWCELSSEEQSEYAALSCLKTYSDGTVVGEDYGNLSMKGKTYIDRFNARVKGDKWECIKTDIHKKFKYSISSGERYQAPEYAWLKIGKVYKTLFINEPLSIIEYQADGISQNNIKYRVTNVNSTISFYKLALSVAAGFINKAKTRINLSRFYLHRKMYCKSIVNSHVLFIFSLAYFLNDIKKINK